MSNISIAMTGPNSARINMPNAIVDITDGHFLRRIQGDLFRLVKTDFNGTVAVKLGNGPRMTLDESVWRDLSDALFAFVLNIDVSNLIGLNAAA